MEAAVTSNFYFCNSLGKEVILREWEDVYFSIFDSNYKWGETIIYLQGIKLETYLKRVDNQDRIFCHLGKLNTGSYELIIKSLTNEKREKFLIPPAKISKDAYELMIEDLQTHLPVDIAIGIARLNGLSGFRYGSSDVRTIEQEVLILKNVLYGIEGKMGIIEAVRILQNRPHKKLKRFESIVNTEKARRPVVSKLGQMMARPHNINHGTKMPLKILDNTVDNNLNIYENQLVKLFIYQIKHRIKRILHSTKIKKYIRTLEEFQREIFQLEVQVTFLNKVNLPNIFIPKPTMVLMRVTPYKEIFEHYINFRKTPFVTFAEKRLDAPLKNTPFLYEMWGTLQVLRALLKIAQEYKFIILNQELIKRDVKSNDLIVNVFPNGKSILTMENKDMGCCISLMYQKTFKEKKGEEYCTISFEQRPDIILEIRKKDDTRKIIIFDPKYKLQSEELEGINANGKPKKVDIDKMHTYRDAIRDLSKNHVVSYAAILYPGATVKYDEGIQAVRLYPTEQPNSYVELSDILSYNLFS